MKAVTIPHTIRALPLTAKVMVMATSARAAGARTRREAKALAITRVVENTTLMVSEITANTQKVSLRF